MRVLIRYTRLPYQRPSPLESQVAKRKQKRMSKEELRTPDQVEAFLNKLWERVTKHKTIIFIFLGLFLAGGIAYSLYEQAEDEKQEATATALRGVFDPLVSPVVADQEAVVQAKETLGTNAYTDRKLQLEAAQKGADEYLNSNADSKAASSIKFVKASTYSAMGDAKKGSEELAAWIEANKGSVLEFAAMIQLGDAQVASGQPSEAKATFQKIVDDSPEGSLARALAHTRLGDLSNPLMTDKGSSEAAVKSYEAAQEIVQGDASNPLSRELELKLAFLK